MAPVRFTRIITITAVVALAALAALQGRPTSPRVEPASTTYPTNAAKIFRWGNAAWNDEFVQPLSSTWLVNKPGQVRDQHGMLTLDAPKGGGTVSALARGVYHQTGRWEARVRARQYTTGGTPFHVVWELVPMNGGDHCGARSIVLSDYRLGSNTTTMHLRNLPDLDFTTSKWLPLTDNQFHTFAVEVTKDRISWFVDTRVFMTEQRPAAMTGASYAMRFRLVATPGARMNQGRMQMDWVRYYTLDRPDAKSVAAPQSTQTTYADAC